MRIGLLLLNLLTLVIGRMPGILVGILALVLLRMIRRLGDLLFIRRIVLLCLAAGSVSGTWDALRILDGYDDGSV